MLTKVSITRCPDYEKAALKRTLEEAVGLLGGIRSFVKPGEKILIKPNLLAAKEAGSAVTTHPAVIAAVIDMVKAAGAEPFVGDSPALGSAAKVAERCGIMRVCLEANAPIVDLKTPVVVDNPAGHRFKRLEVSKETLNADGIINVGKLKTHVQTYLTLGVKNTFGCVPGKLKAQWHLSAGIDTAAFADMLLDLHLFLAPRLNIIDGITAMEGNGPSAGAPRQIGLLFASPDAVAMDTAITLALGARPKDVPILEAARRRGIEQVKDDGFDVCGVPLHEARVKGFKFPPLVSVNFGASLPYFIDKRLRRALTSRPRVDHKKCTLCGVCVDVCPPSIMDKSTKLSIDYDRCIRCYCCGEICPRGAITPVDGWLKKIIPGL
ncbi:MAG: DUF362 domain-containing protein [Deltaproteobacteria bacterium]|nr:DUF362 domain-containing protein [Deltaproteobacteria bacterium]